MCSINLTNFEVWQQDSVIDTDDAILGALTWAPMRKCRFLDITSPKPMTELPNLVSGYLWVIPTNNYQN